jgi:hypothetical protein
VRRALAAIVARGELYAPAEAVRGVVETLVRSARPRWESQAAQARRDLDQHARGTDDAAKADAGRRLLTATTRRTSLDRALNTRDHELAVLLLEPDDPLPAAAAVADPPGRPPTVDAPPPDDDDDPSSS